MLPASRRWVPSEGGFQRPLNRFTPPPHSRRFSAQGNLSSQVHGKRNRRWESYRRVSWRGGNPPHVAKVSSWTWRRTPEGPLQGREVAALEPGRLLSLSQGSRESPRLTAFSCCPPSALGEDLERDSHWDAPAAATIRKGVGENVSTRKGKDSLLCSCRATKPLPHSKEGRIPETAAPNSVEAGLTLPVDL